MIARRAGWTAALAAAGLLAASCTSGGGTASPATTAAPTTMAVAPSTTVAPTSSVPTAGPSDPATVEATAALDVLRQYVRLATSGQAAEAAALTCLDDAGRADLVALVERAVRAWGDTGPTFRPLLLQPTTAGTVEIVYSLTRPGAPSAPADLRARVTGVGGRLQLCDVIYGNHREVADAIAGENRAVTSWQTLDEFGAAVGALDVAALGWVPRATSDRLAAGDPDRGIVRRSVFTFADARGGNGVTATISTVQYDSHPSAAADGADVDRSLSRMAFETFRLAGSPVLGARGGALRSSYLQPANLGPVWDVIDVQPTTSVPLAMSITVDGLDASADHARATALARALLDVRG